MCVKKIVLHNFCHNISKLLLLDSHFIRHMAHIKSEACFMSNKKRKFLPKKKWEWDSTKRKESDITFRDALIRRKIRDEKFFIRGNDHHHQLHWVTMKFPLAKNLCKKFFTKIIFLQQEIRFKIFFISKSPHNHLSYNPTITAKINRHPLYHHIH